MHKSYILLAGALDHLSSENQAKIGDKVYRGRNHDFGLARDDTRATGEEYISVTLDKNGEYPYFTVPVRLLGEVIDDANEDLMRSMDT